MNGPAWFPTIFLACGLFAACGFSESRYNPVNWLDAGTDAQITAWIGHNADYLIEILGEPKRVTELAGGARELAFHDGTGETGADAKCMVLFRVDPFNLVSDGQVFVDEGACKQTIGPP